MKNKRALFAVPYVGWMALFVVAPIVMVVIYAFTTADGGVTMENFASMGTYASVFTRSFWLAILATLICLLIGYPAAYFISREGPRFQRVAMMLIMLPMWMNFLLRTYSWMSILENNGLLNQLFRAVGLLDLLGVDHLQMIGTPGAVVLGMVYNYLPFMILPIYSVIVKLDGSLIEAARDLGAGEARVFFDITLPLVAPAILSGMLLSFAMSMDDVIISIFVTGVEVNTLPIKIYSQIKFGVTPEINALCTLMLAATVLLVLLSDLIGRPRRRQGADREKKQEVTQ